MTKRWAKGQRLVDELAVYIWEACVISTVIIWGLYDTVAYSLSRAVKRRRCI